MSRRGRRPQVCARRPISGDSGLRDIERLVEENRFTDAGKAGKLRLDADKSAYIRHLLSYVDVAQIRRGTGRRRQLW